MGLYIPTSSAGQLPLSAVCIKKGQIYNLDNNEWMNFQFNPQTFEWERSINWAETTWKGDVQGGDLSFINIGPRTFDLSLLFLADPGAPEINYKTNSVKIDSFEAVEELIESWSQIVSSKGRPARVKVIMGERFFDGVIRNYHFKIIESFEDLSAKEGILTLEFREWILT